MEASTKNALAVMIIGAALIVLFLGSLHEKTIAGCLFCLGTPKAVPKREK